MTDDTIDEDLMDQEGAALLAAAISEQVLKEFETLTASREIHVLYVWAIPCHEDGYESLAGIIDQRTGKIVPLMAESLTTAMAMRPLVAEIARERGSTAKLVRMMRAEVMAEAG